MHLDAIRRESVFVVNGKNDSLMEKAFLLLLIPRNIPMARLEDVSLTKVKSLLISQETRLVGLIR